MGLDATGYPRAEILPDTCPRNTDWHWENHVQAYVLDPEFQQSLAGLVDGRCYRVEGNSVTASTSYSCHAHLRDAVAACLGINRVSTYDGVDWPDVDTRTELDDVPFIEWLYFADTEGTIGPVAAANLASDFDAHPVTFAPQNYWMRDLWDTWGWVFHTAAHTGLINYR